MIGAVELFPGGVSGRRSWQRKRLCCALALIAFWGAADLAHAKPLFGYTDDPEEHEAAADLAREGRAKTGRMPVVWAHIEPVEGFYRWRRTDDAYAALRAAGIRPIVTVYGAPCWVATTKCSRQTLYPRSFEAWRGFVDEVVTRYPKAIIQAWNEPNQGHYGGAITPKQAADITMETRAAVAGRSKVIGPAASPTGAWRRYTREVYRQLPRSVPMSLNIYPYSGRPLAEIRKTYRRVTRGQGRRRIWVTEVGIHGGIHKHPARTSASAYKLLNRLGARAIVFHRLMRDKGAIGWEKQGRFGALKRNLSPTPLYSALKRVAKHNWAQRRPKSSKR